jgi:hypothetical protein
LIKRKHVFFTLIHVYYINIYDLKDRDNIKSQNSINKDTTQTNQTFNIHIDIKKNIPLAYPYAAVDGHA